MATLLQRRFQQGARGGRCVPLLLPLLMTLVVLDGAVAQELIHRRSPRGIDPGRIDLGWPLIPRGEQARQDFLATPKGVYLHYCAHCHGDDGRGEGRLWSTELSPKPADLTVLRADKGALLKGIRDGPPAVAKPNLCPPWGRSIPPDKIERLAQYLLSLAGLPAATLAAQAGQSQAPSARPAASAGVVAQPMPWFLLVLIPAESALLAWMLFKRPKLRAPP